MLRLIINPNFLVVNPGPFYMISYGCHFGLSYLKYDPVLGGVCICNNSLHSFISLYDSVVLVLAYSVSIHCVVWSIIVIHCTMVALLQLFTRTLCKTGLPRTMECTPGRPTNRNMTSQLQTFLFTFYGLQP